MNHLWTELWPTSSLLHTSRFFHVCAEGCASDPQLHNLSIFVRNGSQSIHQNNEDPCFPSFLNPSVHYLQILWSELGIGSARNWLDKVHLLNEQMPSPLPEGHPCTPSAALQQGKVKRGKNILYISMPSLSLPLPKQVTAALAALKWAILPVCFVRSLTESPKWDSTIHVTKHHVRVENHGTLQLAQKALKQSRMQFQQFGGRILHDHVQRYNILYLMI